MGVVVVLGWSSLGEERSLLALLAERSALWVSWIHWLNRVAKRSLLRESKAAQSELAHMLVGVPLTAVLLSEPSVLDLEELANSASHSLLGAAETEEHDKWDHQEEEDSLEDVASPVVFSPVSETLSSPTGWTMSTPVSRTVSAPMSWVMSTPVTTHSPAMRTSGRTSLRLSGWTSTTDRTRTRLSHLRFNWSSSIGRSST